MTWHASSASEARIALSVTACRLTVRDSSGKEKSIEGDAVVFAVGVKAVQGIVSSSPELAACPVGTHLIHPYVHVAYSFESPFTQLVHGSLLGHVSVPPAAMLSCTATIPSVGIKSLGANQS